MAFWRAKASGHRQTIASRRLIRQIVSALSVRYTAPNAHLLPLRSGDDLLRAECGVFVGQAFLEGELDGRKGIIATHAATP